MSAFGGSDRLQPLEVAAPQALGGQVLVRVRAAGVGFVDVTSRQGLYVRYPEPGFVPGLEVAGDVVEVGSDVNAALTGRHVFALAQGGGYAELVAVDADRVFPLPEGVSSTEAVALGINALVGHFVTDRSRITTGSDVLVRGASGGIGLMATQLAARRGGRVTAVTSSRERGDRLRAHGAARIIDRSTRAPSDDGQYDVVIDPVGGQDVRRFLAQLRANGTFVLCGATRGLPGGDVAAGILADALEAGAAGLATGAAKHSTREQQLQAEVTDLTTALGEAAVELRVWKKSAEGRLGPSRTSR